MILFQIPDYEVNPTRFSYDPKEKSLLCKGLKFSIRPKKVEYPDVLTKFELLYKSYIISEMKSENRDFPKNKLKDICFSTLKSYSFDKVKRKLLEAESITLRNLIERKDLLFKRHTKATQ